MSNSEPASPKFTATASPKTILVTGDVVRDIYLYQGDRIYPSEPGKIEPGLSDVFGGSWRLWEIIEATRRDDAAFGLDLPPSPKDLQPVHALWTACEGGTKKEHEENAKDDKPKKVWRVDKSLSIDNRRNESVPAADSVQSRSRANGNEKNFRSAEALPA